MYALPAFRATRAVRCALRIMPDDPAAVGLAERLCSAEPAAFRALRKETTERWPGGAHMVSGAQQGRLLHSLVRLARATRVLEVGCFTGYAALWMALALPPSGRLVSLERDERAAEVARRHLAASGVSDHAEVRLGDALASLAALPPDEPPFDIIFLDADKKRCGQYVELLLERELLAPHSLLLVDNVLWKGEVLRLLDPSALTSLSPEAVALDARDRRSMGLRDALHAFSLELAAESRVQQLMLPLRDGLTWAQPLTPAAAADGAGDARRAATLQAVAASAPEIDHVPTTATAEPLPDYLRLVSSAEPAAFRALRKETTERWPGGAHMVSGAQQGRLLHSLVRLARATRVLEVGCFTGYAALWMALALPPSGRLVSLERDERAAEVARRHLAASGVSDHAEVRLGDALASLAALPPDEPPFDMIVWHCATPSEAVDDTEYPARGLPLQALPLTQLLAAVAPHGAVVLIQPDPDHADNTLAMLCADHSLSVVSVPSPDGDGTLLSFISSTGVGGERGLQLGEM